MQCSNEGHLFHFWQRKISFIKSHWKQNEVMLFIPFQGTGFTRHCGDAAAELKQKDRIDSNQRVVLSANLVSNGRLRPGNDSFCF